MHKKVKIILSVCAALIAINDNSCYFIIIFSRAVEVATLIMLVCCLLVVLSGICVCCVG